MGESPDPNFMSPRSCWTNVRTGHSLIDPDANSSRDISRSGIPFMSTFFALEDQLLPELSF